RARFNARHRTDRALPRFPSRSEEDPLQHVGARMAGCATGSISGQHVGNPESPLAQSDPPRIGGRWIGQGPLQSRTRRARARRGRAFRRWRTPDTPSEPVLFGYRMEDLRPDAQAKSHGKYRGSSAAGYFHGSEPPRSFHGSERYSWNSIQSNADRSRRAIW